MTVDNSNSQPNPLPREDIKEIALASRLIDSPELSIEEKYERIDQVSDWALTQLEEMDAAARELVETNVHLFGKTGTELDPQLSIDELLSDDLIANADIIKAALDLRENSTLGYHRMSRSYNDHPEDTDDQRYAKESMRAAAVRATKLLGFLPKGPATATDALNRWLDMQDYEHEVTPGEVSASIVLAAAGLSNHTRLTNILQAIDSGDLETRTIIFAASNRSLRPDEKKKVLDAGLTFGYSAEELAERDAYWKSFDQYEDDRYYNERKPDRESTFGAPYTEVDLCIGAAKDLLGAEFSSMGSAQIPASHYESGPVDRGSRFKKAEVVYKGKPITIYVLSSSYKNGFDAKGMTIMRANTRDTMRSVTPLLPKDAKKVSIHSHDGWIPDQAVSAKEVFDLELGIESVAMGLRNATRLFYARDEQGNYKTGPDGEPIIDILRAEEVIDEFGKTYQSTANLYKKAQALKNNLLSQAA